MQNISNIFEELNKLDEIRKEDDLYYQGAFWIDAPSIKDIYRGNFNIIGIKLESDYNGEYVNLNRSKSSLTHQKLWKEYNKDYQDKSYDYLPRGRVAIYNGTAFIHLNSKMNIPKVIDKIIQNYNLSKLEIEIDLNDT